MGKWPEAIEKHSIKIENKPLCELADTTTSVNYTKYDKSIKGEGYPTEDFLISDPTLYPNRDLPTYEGGYTAQVTILKNEDGSIYPQVTVLDGNKSFSVWDGKKRLGTSALDNFKVEELNGEQLEKYKTIMDIFGDALVELSKLAPDNETFKEGIKYLGIKQQPVRKA